MSSNGDNRRREQRVFFKLSWELSIIDDARHSPDGSQRKAIAWMRGWKRRPERVFWEVQPTGGQRPV
jgi:hypothetical protein